MWAGFFRRSGFIPRRIWWIQCELSMQPTCQRSQRSPKVFQREIVALARNKHKIVACGKLLPVESECLAEQAFESVATDCVPVLPRHTKACSRARGRMGQREQQQVGVPDATTIVVNALKVFRTLQSQISRKSEIPAGLQLVEAIVASHT